MAAETADVLAFVQTASASNAARRAALIAALFTRYQRSLLWYLMRLIHNRDDAEDIAQEAFTRLLGVPHLEADASRARNYLFATATNLARDNYRRRATRSDGAHVSLDDDLELEATDPAPERLIDAERGCAVVDGALRDLPLRSRQAFVLYVHEQMTYERIALALGVSKKTIERDVALTVALCRSRLAPWIET
jgi:RNA polymerase sigma-70 factor (ECF subfamily)